MKNSTILIVFMAIATSSITTTSNTNKTFKNFFSFGKPKSDSPETPKSEHERLLSLTSEDLYNERMKIVDLERLWIYEVKRCNNCSSATPTTTERDIRSAHDKYEQLESSWKDAHATNASFHKNSASRKDSDSPSNNSFFANLISSPLFKSKK